MDQEQSGERTQASNKVLISAASMPILITLSRNLQELTVHLTTMLYGSQQGMEMIMKSICLLRDLKEEKQQV